MAYPLIDDLTGGWLVADGRLSRADSRDAEGFSRPVTEPMYYEVIRVLRGVPLFWEDHMARLSRSVAGAFPVDAQGLRRDALRLLEAEGRDQCNLRIVLTGRHSVLHLGPYYYPSEGMIEHGVACGLLSWERETPNIKTVREDYKRAVAAAFSAGGPDGRPFEILLVDREGRFTEGSRSNLFFVRDGTVYTAPDDRILLGITRSHVHKAVLEAGFRLETAMFTYDELVAGAVSAAFLTGSPIDVLPVARIGALELDPADPVVRAVRRRYAAILDDYVRASAPEGGAGR
ncbi:MAG: aminotransferase class IV [Clostridia bacterium]|nr:aminotransferase class IV [Clostridia bacterium]